MRFYTTKQIWLELGISETTLENRIAKGYFPPLQKVPSRKNGKGYFEDVFELVKAIEVPKPAKRKIPTVGEFSHGESFKNTQKNDKIIPMPRLSKTQT